MSFANLYLSKHSLFPPFIKTPTDLDLNMIVVIPCYNETKLLETFESLWNCHRTRKKVEIITVINSSIISESQILENNLNTYESAQKWISIHKDEKLSFELIYKTDLPAKDFGVGLARKIGMDEAIFRFNLINNKNGIIINIDADTLCEPDYLIEIENQFAENHKITGASIYFEHPIQGNEFPENYYLRIIQYELYLRYFINGLRYSKFPYSFQTIGSAFAVRAYVYAKQGGMNKRQAGEDFYFLHKVIPLGNFIEINSTKVIPSPRASTRVPFGTGAMISKLVIEDDPQFYTCQVSSFEDLRNLFTNILVFFKLNINDFDDILLKFPQTIQEFLNIYKFKNELDLINQHSPNLKIFTYRFFQWFDAFRVIKFINFAQEKFYPKIELKVAVKELCNMLNIRYEESWQEKDFLIIFRDIDKSGGVFVSGKL